MDDCKHEDLHYMTFQANPKSAESPIFHTVRCKKCNQLIGVFPLEMNASLIQVISKELAEIRKTLRSIGSAIQKK